MKIEPNIPLPMKYPFAEMKIGDSFALPDPTKRTAVSVSAHRYGHMHGMKFTVRKTPTGYRCWRTE